MKSKISIIVPVYKCEEYLPKCIDSILRQTYRNIEVILVDDGSPDNCGEICDQYAKMDDRIKVVHKDNGGANAARKSGMNIATGELVGFVDSDDWIEPNMYEILQKPFDDYKVDVSVCSYFYEATSSEKQLIQLDSGFYDKNRLRDLVYPSMIYNDSYYNKLINSSLWDKLYKKEVILDFVENSNDEIIVGEDSTILYPTLLAANSIMIKSNECLYHYRQVETSIMHTYRPGFFKQNKIWLQQMLSQCLKVEGFDVSEQILKYFIGLTMSSINNEYKIESQLSISEKRKQLNLIVEDKDVIKGIKKLDTEKYSYKFRIVIWLIKHKYVTLLHCAMLLKSFVCTHA